MGSLDFEKFKLGPETRSTGRIRNIELGRDFFFAEFEKVFSSEGVGDKSVDSARTIDFGEPLGDTVGVPRGRSRRRERRGGGAQSLCIESEGSQMRPNQSRDLRVEREFFSEFFFFKFKEVTTGELVVTERRDGILIDTESLEPFKNLSSSPRVWRS